MLQFFFEAHAVRFISSIFVRSFATLFTFTHTFARLTEVMAQAWTWEERAEYAGRKAAHMRMEMARLLGRGNVTKGLIRLTCIETQANSLGNIVSSDGSKGSARDARAGTATNLC